MSPAALRGDFQHYPSGEGLSISALDFFHLHSSSAASLLLSSRQHLQQWAGTRAFDQHSPGLLRFLLAAFQLSLCSKSIISGKAALVWTANYSLISSSFLLPPAQGNQTSLAPPAACLADLPAVGHLGTHFPSSESKRGSYVWQPPNAVAKPRGETDKCT